MNKNRVCLVLLSFLVVAMTFYFHRYNIGVNSEAKNVVNKNALETTINLRKNKRKNSAEYKLLQAGDIQSLEEHISNSDEELVDTFKNFLLSKKMIAQLSTVNKKAFYSLITNLKTENKYVEVYKNRIIPFIFKDVNDQDFLSQFDKTIKDNDIKMNFVILSEMKNWETVPGFVISYVNGLIVEKEDHTHMNVLNFYSNLKNQEQLKPLYSKINKKYKELSERNKTLFQKINILKSNELNLTKDDFYSLLENEGVEWSEVKINIIQKYGLLNEKKEILRKIAKSSDSVWIKKIARTLLEQAK